MPRHFNTAGPCNPVDHFMIPPERRLPGLGRLLEEKSYFVVHAPRQAGKTTLFRTVAQRLNEEGRYAALLASCEVGQAAGGDVERGIAAVLGSLRLAASLQLPEALRPPAADPAVPAEVRFQELLTRWAQESATPIVLFLDEIDSLVDQVLVSVLRQLRSGYPERPARFPHAVALIGLRDVRDLSFNIKAESLALPNFTAAEVAELYGQHTVDTGQDFTPAALTLAFELTGGQPWLVNALARQIVNTVVPDPAVPVEPQHVEQAKEILVQRRDTHLDSLLKRLKEARVRRVLEPLLAGEILSAEVLHDDVQFVQDLGLVVATSQGLAIANPIYREVIPRTLTELLELSIAPPRPSYVAADGRLLFPQLLADFVSFWRQHAEAFLDQAPYAEAAAQLVFMAFLHKIVNGGGQIDREYAVGRGRIDLCVRWPHPGGVERFAIELKVWRDGRSDPLAAGLDQLTGYLERLGLDAGTLLIFDRRQQAPPRSERTSRQEIEHQGKRIDVMRL